MQYFKFRSSKSELLLLQGSQAKFGPCGDGGAVIQRHNAPKVEGRGEPGCNRCYWRGRRSREIRAAEEGFTADKSALLFLSRD